MDINQILTQVKAEVEVVQDGPIVYMVLNTGDDFVFDENTVGKVNKALDQVEAIKDRAVLVTISKSSKRFSTGFSLPYWKAHPTNSFKSISLMQALLARMLSLGMPTICVMKGHVYAGGLIFAMCHDKRIMKADSGRLCLSEIMVGLALPPAYSQVLVDLMPKQILREMLMGRAIGTQEALDKKVVSALFTSDLERQEMVAAFAKEFAQRSGPQLQTEKARFHHATIQMTEVNSFGPFDGENLSKWARVGGKL